LADLQRIACGTLLAIGTSNAWAQCILKRKFGDTAFTTNANKEIPMEQTILVFGATGTVGRQIVDSIPDNEDYTVLAASRAIPDDLWTDRDNVKKCPIDLSQPESIKTLFEGVERVFLMTPLSSAQVTFAQAIIDAAKAVSVQQIVYESVLGADKVTGIPAFEAYRAVEKYLEESGVPYTILRRAPLMENFLANFKPDQSDSLMLPLGDASVHWLCARDFGLVAARMLLSDNHMNETFEICSEEAHSAAQVAEALSKLVGREIRYVPVARDAALASMVARGISAESASMLIDLLGRDVASTDASAPPVFTVHPFNATPPEIPMVPFLTGVPSSPFSVVAEQFADNQPPNPDAV
jgi:uncharacterized protein YbjT (DUF2867 family)